ncbi:hypothetical protein RAS1_04990 [Phycisphaerae bacterium RAS1]|nr:hypothetical protein RAS1_04990 [Phycisphaerae bacterium RAS1]
MNVLDINSFTLALSSPAAYAAAYPECDISTADINGDGSANVLDINYFVSLLAGGQETARGVGHGGPTLRAGVPTRPLLRAGVASRRFRAKDSPAR